MNFWTGLILGILIGWLVEWIIDWLFWRRDVVDEGELAVAAGQRATDLDLDCQEKLAAAELDYHERLAAVEAEWRERLNLNEQQWQSQFAAVDAERESLRAQLDLAAEAEVVAEDLALEEADLDEAILEDFPGDEPVIDESIPAEDADEGLALAGAVGASLAARAGSEFDVTAPEFDATGTELDMATPALDVAVPDLDRGAAAFDMPVPELEVTGPELDIAAPELDLTVPELDVAVPELDLTAPAFDVAAPAFDAAADVPALDMPAGVATEARFNRAEPFEAQRDDLTRVRGIGPRYAALLAENGITTYEALAAADPNHLRAILKPGPMQQLNFGSWSAQAAALATTRTAHQGDDLTRLEGIGPMYAERLRNGGITTFAQLAETDENTLATLISAPAWRRINFGSWIEQARLMASGDTAGLQALQTRLNRREGDNLLLIHGLGERSAAGLRAAGLDSFAALAAATPEQVEAAVHAGGGRGGDYAAWIAEAGQRAAGRRVARAPRRSKATVIAACPQDLSAVPGIGSVFEERLYRAGIGSYWELAELPLEELRAILGATAGRVDAGSIKAEAMRLAAESNSIGRGWSGAAPDDFEALGGIGEIYERRLYDAGICTFDALAATTPERLAEICQAPALRLADYAGWIAHAAELAAARS